MFNILKIFDYYETEYTTALEFPLNSIEYSRIFMYDENAKIIEVNNRSYIAIPFFRTLNEEHLEKLAINLLYYVSNKNAKPYHLVHTFTKKTGAHGLSVFTEIKELV